MKINKLNISLIILAFGLMFFSCGKNKDFSFYSDPTIKTTSTYPISGEWWVTLRDDQGNLVVDHVPFLTYNTSSDKGDSVWVDDQGNIDNFKIKAACNPKAGTFSVDSIQSIVSDIRVAIKDGKVILKGGRTKGGNVSDSIYMQIGFTDGGGITYVISGVRRTGFKQDDY